MAVLFLLVVQFFACFVSAQPSLGTLETPAAKQDRIASFPGAPDDLELSAYGGYIPVDSEGKRQLYYTFVEAAVRPAAAPLVLWLNGGPGCSSLAGGLFSELGPFYPTKDGKALKANPWAWHKHGNANIIFLDSPAFVGFSFSENARDRVVGDWRTAWDTVAFLLGFIQRYPRFKYSPFYITGESYGGHYVPNLAAKIMAHNKQPDAWPAYAAVGPDYGSAKIQLKGFMVGNAWTDAEIDNRGAADFWHSHALVSTETYKGALETCDFSRVGPLRADGLESLDDGRLMDEEDLGGNKARKCAHFVNKAMSDIKGINIYDIYADVCTPAAARGAAERFVGMRWPDVAPEALRGAPPASSLQGHSSGDPAAYDPCIDDEVAVYLNDAKVQAALHANTSGMLPGPWAGCSDYVEYKREDLLSSMLDVYQHVLGEGLKVLVYSGDVDAIVPVIGTRRWIESLGLAVRHPWHQWHADGQVAGFEVEYLGLKFATVRGAGHMVPYTQPARAAALFNRFLNA